MATHKSLKHPFGFDDDGNRVVPAEVADGNTVACPRDGCDEPLHVRGPSTNGTVRHFYHPGSGNSGGVSHTGGGIGESATHKNYKSHAASALLNFFGDFIEESTVEEIFEQRVSVADGNRYRQADTLVTFETPSSAYGKGIIIEVQHENHGKDKDAVERQYLEAGYSVYWTNSDDHYSPKRNLFDRDQLDDEIVTVWPNAVPESYEWEGVHPDLRCFILDSRGPMTMERLGYDDQGRIAGEEYEALSRAEHPRQRARWELPDSFDQPSVERTVQLPREWYEERAREYFRETPWNDLFGEYEWDARTTLPTASEGTRRNRHTAAKLLLAKWLAGDDEYLLQYHPSSSDSPIWKRLSETAFCDEQYVGQWELDEGHVQRLAKLETRLVPPSVADALTTSYALTSNPEPPEQLDTADAEVRTPPTPDADDLGMIHKADGETCVPDEHHIVADGHIRYCERCGTSTQTLINHPEIEASDLLEGVV